MGHAGEPPDGGEAVPRSGRARREVTGEKDIILALHRSHKVDFGFFMA